MFLDKQHNREEDVIEHLRVHIRQIDLTLKSETDKEEIKHLEADRKTFNFSIDQLLHSLKNL